MVRQRTDDDYSRLIKIFWSRPFANNDRFFYLNLIDSNKDLVSNSINWKNLQEVVQTLSMADDLFVCSYIVNFIIEIIFFNVRYMINGFCPSTSYPIWCKWPSSKAMANGELGPMLKVWRDLVREWGKRSVIDMFQHFKRMLSRLF